MRHAAALFAGSLFVFSALSIAGPGLAHGVSPVVPVAGGFDGPLQIDVGASGQVYVGQAFTGTLTKIRPNSTTKDLVSVPGQEITGVASRGNDVAFTWTNGDPDHPAAELRLRTADGRVRTIANLYAYEKRQNPDAVNVYGFKTLSARCAARVPAELGGGKPYTGVVDSHPYAVANAPDGGWYVADAGANDILYVSPTGKVQTSNIMHRIKVTVTTAIARHLGLPACTVNQGYSFEPVPTDVEVTSDGNVLYISLLPGGPEDLSIGPPGQVVHTYPCAGCSIADQLGDQNRLGVNFAGASNVAVGGPGNRLYVSELFGDDVLVRKGGVWETFVELPAPASIEVVGSTLYVAYDVFGDGKVAKIAL